MQNETYLPGDTVTLKDGRHGLLYAYTQNSRNPLGRNASQPANWYFLPDCVGTNGMVVTSQPCTVSELGIESKVGHREGNWPAPGHILGFEERQRVYVDHMEGRIGCKRKNPEDIPE